MTLGGSARVTGNNANLGAGFLLHVGTIACTGTPKVCANPGSGSDGCFPDDPCGSPCAATCPA